MLLLQFVFNTKLALCLNHDLVFAWRQQQFVYDTKINLAGAKMPITGFQIRAARSLVGMEQVALAERAGVSANTIRNMEAFGMLRVKVRTETLDAVTDALKQSGVMFLDGGPTPSGGPGVRLDYMPPILFRRDDVPEHSWVAFAFDHGEKRNTGFVHYDALGLEPGQDAAEAFDKHRHAILRKAVMKLEDRALDEEGRVHIHGDDALPR